jgi:ABC-type nitrate/sulfonate/bicarbonate transport system substrate-binding protein
MRPAAFLPLVVAAAALAVAGCGSDDDTGTAAATASSTAAAAAAPAQTETVSVALGWTPNTDYTGVYVADKLGYYAKQGIKLKIIPYASTSPETLVSAGKADFGFSYQAGVAYARAAGSDVIGVFSPNAKNTYAIGVRADDDSIKSPKDLSGKTYAGFGTPDEGPELSYIIKADGGTGKFKNVTLSTSAYQAVYAGKADFTIPVVTWEGVEAKLVGKPLKTFRFEDYGFPTQYASLIASSDKWLQANPELAKKFVTATQEGYEYAAAHPDEAAKILVDANPSALKNPELVTQSEELLAKDYRKDAQGRIGFQDPTVWKNYGEFLYSNGLLTDGDGKKLATEPDWTTYYSNDYLPAS